MKYNYTCFIQNSELRTQFNSKRSCIQEEIKKFTGVLWLLPMLSGLHQCPPGFANVLWILPTSPGFYICLLTFTNILWVLPMKLNISICLSRSCMVVSILYVCLNPVWLPQVLHGLDGSRSRFMNPSHELSHSAHECSRWVYRIPLPSA